jgi:hypothetical protein
MELGRKWLEKDFNPATAVRNISGHPCLLILDRHNSHCTYSFCAYAALHSIIIFCLIPHTIHRCQPCDVGVFGPLNSTWKAQVNTTSQKCVWIRKNNLLLYYHAAQQQAFTKKTIKAAFCKMGIHPFNPSVIKDKAYAPALNSTTTAAQPVPATLTTLL